MTKEEYKQLLRVMSPTLYTIDVLNNKFINDLKIQFGEIHYTAIVQNGKIVRIEAFPVISQKVENLT